MPCAFRVISVHKTVKFDTNWLPHDLGHIRAQTYLCTAAPPSALVAALSQLCCAVLAVTVAFLGSGTHWPRHASYASPPARTGTHIIVYCCPPRRAGGCSFFAFLHCACYNRCISQLRHTHWHRHSAQLSAPAHIGTNIVRSLRLPHTLAQI